MTTDGVLELTITRRKFERTLNLIIAAAIQGLQDTQFNIIVQFMEDKNYMGHFDHSIGPTPTPYIGSLSMQPTHTVGRAVLTSWAAAVHL